MDDTKIIAELNNLIKQGNYLAADLHTRRQRESSSIYSNEDKKAPVRKWECYIRNLLKLRFSEKSDFYQQFNLAIHSEIKFEEYYQENVQMAASVLDFIKESLEKGFTDDLFYRQEIILFSDMLKQAEEFLGKGLKLAAAIYGRIVMELTIIEYANKNKIDTNKKFNEIIIDLRKNGFIHEPFEDSLRANYRIGSWAAHGDEQFNVLSDNEIREFLSFIRDKVLTLD